MGNARRAEHVLISDLGNVLIGFDRSRTYKTIGDYAHVDASLVRRAVERSDLRERYERGDPDLADASRFLRAFQDLLVDHGVKAEVPCDIIRDAWNDIFWEQKEVTDMVRHLRRTRGLPLILLSDTNELHYEYYRRAFPHIHELFDVEILSFERRLSKEHRASDILALALREAKRLLPGVSTRNILYVDDRADFVEAARALDITGHVFCQPAGFRDWLTTQGFDLSGV